MNNEQLQSIKQTIIRELKPIMPDIHVCVNARYNNVHTITPVRITDGSMHYPYGQRSYLGMTEACINVFWDEFFDRICGNGWMYGQTALFKFDIKDGDCKYCPEPTFINDLIDRFIKERKQRHKEWLLSHSL